MGTVGFAAMALDQSHDMIKVLDDVGTIVFANAAWRAGAEWRGGTAPGRGDNYLEMCEQTDAVAVAAGIRAVLCGDRPRFEIDYSDHSSTQDQWYSLEVTPLGDPVAGVVLTHVELGTRLDADPLRRHGRDVDPVTMLARSPTGVPELARMLADAQAHGNSLAVVTITLCDLSDIETRHGRRHRDDIVCHTVARVYRFIRADDAMIRPSTNRLVLFATLADAQGGEFLRDRICRSLEVAHRLGASDVDSRVEVTVVSSDKFSTLDSLLSESATEPARPSPDAESTQPSNEGLPDQETRQETGQDGTSNVLLSVFSLPDGHLQAANAAARSLFQLTEWRSGQLHVRDVTSSTDARHVVTALAGLASGATDSYRAQRTLTTPDGPVALLISVRRLVVGSGALAVVLAVPEDQQEQSTTLTDEMFATALVAGTIAANGSITSVSPADSPMETELTAALIGTLREAAHPDDADLADELVASMRLRGSAAGVVRLPHSQRGWVACDWHLFTINRPGGHDTKSGSPVVGDDTYAFLLSATVDVRSLTDRAAKLERHIRRIASEVHGADVDMGERPAPDAGLTAALDVLELTARQRDIVERLARGQRVASIASELYISRSTVRNHLAQAYRRVGVHSQDELLKALRPP